MTISIEQKPIYEKLQKIFNIFASTDAEIRPHFFLTGPSGSGKTHLIQTLCEEEELNFFEINAAQLTKEGIAGNSLSKALVPLTTMANLPSVCLVDEFDKMFISSNNNSVAAHESTSSIQNEFLKVLESPTTQVFGDYGKYTAASCDNVLFIFAGAFNGEEDITLDRLRDFGVKTEFLGRVGLMYNTTKPSLDSLLALLSKSTLLESYLDLFPEVNKKTAIKEISSALADKHKLDTLGVRAINTLVHQYFINGGLEPEEVKKTSFKKTLKFKKDQ